MLRWGYEYGYQFKSGLYLSAELDWNIIYPRNFDFKGREVDFFAPPISLWYTPLTNFQIGWAFTKTFLATLGLIYYWGLSASTRHRISEQVFLEVSSVIWLDRIFRTGGFYGGGFDNLHLSFGLGYKF